MWNFQPNAGHEPLPEAGAQRTLEAVGSMPLFCRLPLENEQEGIFQFQTYTCANAPSLKIRNLRNTCVRISCGLI
jgi:hypothetical protein